MCGILCILGVENADELRQKALELQKKLRHRGPDWSGIYCKGKNVMCHERLAIVDPESGDQPLYGREDDSLVLAVNGEIYNHKELESSIRKSIQKDDGIVNIGELRTKSDCECLLQLYQRDGVELLKNNIVKGMYSFVLLDEITQEFIVARDHVGIIPLYYGYGEDGSFWISSEMKAIVDDVKQFWEFPPGHLYDSKNNKFVPFVNEGVEQNNWFVKDDKDLANYPPLPTKKIELSDLKEAFEKSVRSHLMSDVPYGVLLSGGLDSSLVASIMAKHCRRRQEDDEETEAHYPRLHSFCIGLEGSPDHVAAQEVADYLGTVHHAFKFTIQQGLDALKDVIYHIETFDVTTIRASTPMFLMSRKIRASGVKMVLSGEGADEIFGGYLYFHKAPNAQEFHEETIRKVHQLSKYDCLRANKSTMAWSLEARVPFLDREFLNIAFSFDPRQKMCRDEEDESKKRCEKYLLRKAFDVYDMKDEICSDEICSKTETEKIVSKKKRVPKSFNDGAYLPDSVLWRQKEQFSDGVGYSWIHAIQDFAAKNVTDLQLEKASFRFPIKTPKTKEGYLYRSIFEDLFGDGESVLRCVQWQDSIACSSETALKWDASFQGRADASGRAVAGVHESAYDEKQFASENFKGASKDTKKSETSSKLTNSDAKRRKIDVVLQ